VVAHVATTPNKEEGMACIAYLRVSKKDGRQTVENQRPTCKR
jgi:hypothetical protein